MPAHDPRRAAPRPEPRRRPMLTSFVALALVPLQAPRAHEAPRVAFVDVHVLPMTDERVLADQTVLVEGGRIARIGPAAEVELPAGVTRIDGHGRWLVPGFVDSHVHLLDEGDLVVYLANGVSTVRNLKGLPWHLELHERLASGEVLGPRLVTSGPFVNEPQVRTVEDVQRAVAEQREEGYDCIKIHGNLAPDAYEALLEEASLAGLPVVGHAPRNLLMTRLLELGGQREISHAEEYLYTWFDRVPGGPDDAAFEHIARATAEAGVTVTPNLVAFLLIVRQIEDLDRELARPEMAFVAPPGKRTWQPDLNKYERDFDANDAAVMAERYAVLERLTRAFQAAGVRLLTGSDAMNPVAVPGFSLHDELALLVKAGLTPYQALRAATASAGEFLENGAGRVVEGAPADLVLLAANPLESIERTRAIEGVCAGGRWLAKDELDRRMKALADDYARESAFMSRFDSSGMESALAYRKEVRAKDPQALLFRPEGLESLALLFGLVGNHAAARTAAELAVEEFAGRWTAWVRLAEACAALEDEPAAVAALVHARELHPDDPRLARALEELAGERR